MEIRIPLELFLMSMPKHYFEKPRTIHEKLPAALGGGGVLGLLSGAFRGGVVPAGSAGEPPILILRSSLLSFLSTKSLLLNL